MKKRLLSVKCLWLAIVILLVIALQFCVQVRAKEDAVEDPGNNDFQDNESAPADDDQHQHEENKLEEPPGKDFEDGDGENVSKVKITSKSSGDFTNGFIATLSVIIVSELGDKTFFIAAILAMRNSRTTIFIGAMAALILMHVLSAFFGYATTIIPRVYTFYVSSFLFAVFGIKMLKEGWQMSPNETQEEFDEVQEEVMKRDKEDPEIGLSSPRSGSSGENGTDEGWISPTLWRFVSKIFLQAFTMTFLAEWGDRSQLATIVLAAREEIKGVILGGILGHSLCTGLAVVGGRFIAQRISVRTVTLIGGVVFLCFAMTALFMDPNEN